MKPDAWTLTGKPLTPDGWALFRRGCVRDGMSRRGGVRMSRHAYTIPTQQEGMRSHMKFDLIWILKYTMPGL